MMHPAEFVATFILTELCARDANVKTGAFLKEIDPRLKNLTQFKHVHEVASWRIKGVSHHINEIIVVWALDRIPLQLKFTVPSPEQILAMQCQGERCVTCIVAPDKISNYDVDEHDALSFCLHDLMHAYHFYKNPQWRLAQMGFARWVRDSIDIFHPLLTAKDFAKKFEYAIADMNSHPVHLLKYLRAVIDEKSPDRINASRDAVWPQLAARIHPEIQHGLLAVNRPEETTETCLLLTSWLTQIGSSTIPLTFPLKPLQNNEVSYGC